LPRSKQAEDEKPKEVVAEESAPPMPKIPSILDIMSPTPEEPEEDEGAAVATEATMKYLMRKDREKAKMTQELLRILPELGKSDNPLVAIMVDKLISGGPARNDDISELKELAKAMSYTVILPELMKDVAKSIKGGGADNKEVLVAIMQMLNERDRRLQEMIQELKQNKDQQVIDALREEFYQSMNAIVETFSKSLEEIRAQIAASQAPQPVDPLAPLEQLDQWVERSQTLLQKLGYVVAKPEELDPAMAANIDAEKEIKLKELELKSKEIEAKNQLYSKLGEAVAKLVENPDNMAKLLRGLTTLFRAGPPMPPAGVPGQPAGHNVINPIASKPSRIPSLAEFTSHSGGAQDGGDEGGA